MSKPGRNTPAKLTDRERILVCTIRRLVSVAILSPGSPSSKSIFPGKADVQPGDLVVALTSRGDPHEFSVGWYVAPLDDGAVVREIGSGALCNFRNEDFVPVRLNPSDALEAHTGQRVFYERVRKAINKVWTYWHRYDDLEFDGDQVTVWIRKAFSDRRYGLRMPWSKGTTIKSIVDRLVELGYGKREFDGKVWKSA